MYVDTLRKALSRISEMVPFLLTGQGRLVRKGNRANRGRLTCARAPGQQLEQLVEVVALLCKVSVTLSKKSAACISLQHPAVKAQACQGSMVGSGLLGRLQLT